MKHLRGQIDKQTLLLVYQAFLPQEKANKAMPVATGRKELTTNKPSYCKFYFGARAKNACAPEIRLILGLKFRKSMLMGRE